MRPPSPGLTDPRGDHRCRFARRLSCRVRPFPRRRCLGSATGDSRRSPCKPNTAAHQAPRHQSSASSLPEPMLTHCLCSYHRAASHSGNATRGRCAVARVRQETSCAPCATGTPGTTSASTCSARLRLASNRALSADPSVYSQSVAIVAISLLPAGCPRFRSAIASLRCARSDLALSSETWCVPPRHSWCSRFQMRSTVLGIG